MNNENCADLYQMYQAFTLQIPSDSMNLKAAELHPKIMAALDDMYSHPDRFTPFFRVARELPSLQSVFRVHLIFHSIFV
jgi:hypothetical protein